MRNLLKYPITNDEIVTYLSALSLEISKEGGVGDMRPLLLLEAAETVKKFRINPSAD